MDKPLDSDEQHIKVEKKVEEGRGGEKLPTRIGNYEMRQTLGRGTFGKVKSGVHVSTGEKVAIKIIDKKSIEDEDDELRIQREV